MPRFSQQACLHRSSERVSCSAEGSEARSQGTAAESVANQTVKATTQGAEHREQLAELRAEHRGVFTATRPGLPNSAPSRTTSTGAPSRPTAASTAHARRLETKLKELQVGQARQPPSGWLEGDAHQLSAVEFEAVAVGVIDSAVPADDSRGGARQVPPQVVRRQKPKPSRARR